MQTVLFTSTIFGPIHSRRLGTSLGINLMPDDGKVCSFDCLYCEAGFNAQGPGKSGLPSRSDVKRLLEEKLSEMKREGKWLDVITFSGNGEPTLHPDFAGVIDDTMELRDKYFPDVKISVLTNATQLHREDVCAALRRVDNNLLKLDSGITDTILMIDRPGAVSFTAEKVIGQMAGFGCQCIVQTMLLRGTYNGRIIDNTTEIELKALIDAYKRINPREVMIYSIDRKTPAEELKKVPHDEMVAIGARIAEATGLPVQVS